MLRMKPTVADGGVAPAIWFALGVATVARRNHTELPLVVTSLCDGVHQSDSLHYKGLGADLRTRDIHRGEAESWAAELKARLEPYGFDVILESDHLHIEFDPKAGQQFIVRVE